MSLYLQTLRMLPGVTGLRVLRQGVTVPQAPRGTKPQSPWSCFCAPPRAARGPAPWSGTVPQLPVPLRVGMSFTPTTLARINNGPVGQRAWWRPPRADPEPAPVHAAAPRLDAGENPPTTVAALGPAVGKADDGVPVAEAPARGHPVGEGMQHASEQVPVEHVGGASGAHVTTLEERPEPVQAVMAPGVEDADQISQSPVRPGRGPWNVGTPTTAAAMRRRAPRRRNAGAGPTPVAEPSGGAMGIESVQAWPSGAAPRVDGGDPEVVHGFEEGPANLNSPPSAVAATAPMTVGWPANTGDTRETSFERLLRRLLGRRITLLLPRHRRHRGILLRVRRDHVTLVNWRSRLVSIATDHIAAVLE